MSNKTVLHVEGTHCAGCKARIESKVAGLKGVESVLVDYASGACTIQYDESKVSQARIVTVIKDLGYDVQPALDGPWSEGQCASATQSPVPLARKLILGAALLGLISAGYWFVQKSGALTLLARLSDGNLGYGLIFVVGLLAGFHCMGMCGGLVVAYTAGRRGSGGGQSSVLPHLQYNLGRVISYSIVGAILGGTGSFFGISPAFTSVLTLVVALVMVVMGISLLTDGRLLSKFNLALLSAVARFLFGQEGHPGQGPLVVGLLNGFMPCGPLQAMQLYALASGSVVRGALSMAVYGLGTVPMMFGLGSIISLLSGIRVKQALKLSGAAVVVLGLLMLNRGLANFGMGLGASPGPQVASQAPSAVTPAAAAAVVPTAEAEAGPQGFQTVRMQVTYQGYVPNTLQVKKGIPVRWVIDVKQMTRCTDTIILPEYNIRKPLQMGENVVEFTPDRTGVIQFSCWMQMVWGKFVVS